MRFDFRNKILYVSERFELTTFLEHLEQAVPKEDIINWKIEPYYNKLKITEYPNSLWEQN